MAYKLKQSGDYRKRRNFSMIKNSLAISDLLEVQTESYKWFATEGIKEVFETFSPIESFSGSLSLEFGEYEFGTPRYSIKECKDRQITYAAPLKVQTRLFNNETGEVKEQEIFLGDMPLMTDAGTFIINGAERVVVSQLVRSPSVYYSKEIDKNGKPVFASKVIPSRGTWLEYETDAKDVIYIRIDRNRKVPMTTLLRAVGLSSDEDILSLFDNDVYLKNTIEKDSTHNTDEALIEIYEKLRPGEPTTLDSSKNQLITRFFDDFHYDLAKVGRYKFNKKLNVKDRLLGNRLAEDIIIDGEVKIEKGTLISKEVYEELCTYLDNGYGVTEAKVNEDLTINSSIDEHNKIQVIHLYSNVDDKKIVKVIGNDPSANIMNLTMSDFYASVSYYLNLNEGIGKDDEIDHLGNRRVKQVGELLQNQFKIGFSRMERVIRERMTTQDIETVTPKTLINIRPVTAVIKEFFGSSQLSQFMDQTNPIAELTHKRRLSALGPGGLSRERAGFDFAKYPNAKLTLTNIPADPRLDAIYAKYLDYSVTPIIREIRRERRVETMMEGMRYEDLMRWKAGRLFTVPVRGMKMTQEKIELYSKNRNDEVYKDYPYKVTVPIGEVGNKVIVDDDGFIIPYPTSTTVIKGVRPWDDKRYYYPIPLNEMLMNPLLTQNPGWKDINR